MRTSRPAVIAALATTLIGSGLALAGVPAQAAAPTITCQGRPATVVGSTGTEGDDVMVVLPTQGVTAQALGGNDLICIVAAPEGGIRSVVVDAGPGNDTVVNESADVEGVWYTTMLGTGSDSYVGLDADIPDDPHASPFYETVYAGVRDLTRSDLAASQDTEADVIDTRGGDDVVHSGSTAPGTPANTDTIITGSGDDTVEWAGEQGGGTLDLGTGENALSVYPGWRGAAVVVDAPTRTATADGRPVLRWAGDVVRYDLRLDNRDQSFVGTSADETLILAGSDALTPSGSAAGLRQASMGAGADTLLLYSMGSGTVDGGPGRDTWVGSSCATADVRIGDTFTCTLSQNRHSFDFESWEDLLVKGGDVKVVGTNSPEKIKVVATTRLQIRGRGGRDILNATAPADLRGADRPLISGGRGKDRVVGSHAPDRLRGGPGSDKLFGESNDDDLRGGRGRDKAFGQSGRDRCLAEVRRSCELH